MMEEPSIKFLIAEDEPPVQSLLCSVLEERDYHDIQVAGDGVEAIARMRKGPPDILITDLKMPRLGGEELAREALILQPDLTILVTTGNGTVENAVRLMKYGVFDFITKPFSIDELAASIERAVQRTRKLAELEQVREVIDPLMAALESKDVYLRGHSRRVSRLAGFLATKLGWPRKKVRLLEYAALVHDVGKIGVHEDILNKPSALDPEEAAQMRKHPLLSRAILGKVACLQEVLDDVYHHHERYDGKGYPAGLKGEAIPLGARIIALCDAYDAMASDRAYRSAMSEVQIVAAIRNGQGTQFDPSLVDLFMAYLPEVKEIHGLDTSRPPRP